MSRTYLVKRGKYFSLFLIAQRAPAQGRLPAPESLALDVELDQTACLLGEPLLVRRSLVNNGRSSITVPYDRADPGARIFQIDDRQGRQMRRLPQSKDDRDGLPVVTIEQGERLLDIFNLFDDYAISEPGEYKLVARFQSVGHYRELTRTPSKGC